MPNPSALPDEPPEDSIGADLIAGLEGFLRKLKSGEPIEVTTVRQEQTPDGPLTTREKKTI